MEQIRPMQGKSCFNFTEVDEVLFSELAGLTRRGMQSYEQEGYVAPEPA